MIALRWDWADLYLSKYRSILSPPGSHLRTFLTPVRSDRLGSRSVTVCRRSMRVLDTRVWASPPLPLPIAAAGRSSMRLETAAEDRISRSPMLVIEPTFCAKAGDFVSMATRSATKALALLRSSTVFASSSGTAPAACSGATTTTGWGGASTRAPAGGGAAGVVVVGGVLEPRSSSDMGVPPGGAVAGIG